MSKSPIEVLLIEDNPGDARLVERMLADAKDALFHLERADRLTTGLERLRKGGIDALLLDLSLPDSQGLTTFERARSGAPGVAIVLLTGADDEALALRAVQMGAQDYLVKGNIDGRRLGLTVRFAVERQRKQARESSHGQPKEPGKVFAFVGSKGGVGTTTIAINIAACLAKANKNVIAVELRTNYGTFGQQLRVAPVNNLSHVLELDSDRIDEQEVGSRLVKLPFGPRVLFGPQKLNEFREIDPAKAAALVQALMHMADYVIIDLPGIAFAAVEQVLRQATLVGLVLDREPLSVACGQMILEQLRAWGLSLGMVGVIVVNRSALTCAMKAGPELASQLGCGLLGVVTPAAELCMRANSSGTPLVLSEPRSTAASTVLEITNKLLRQDLLTLQPVA